MESLKVVDMNKYRLRENKSIYEDILLILEDYKDGSVHTYNSYKGIYQEFFLMVLNKDIQYVSWYNLLSITYSDVLRYRNNLKKNNSNNTINIKIACISSLYIELNKINRNVDVVVTNVKPLSTVEEDNRYGSLTEKEMNGLIDYCTSLSDRMKPIQKKMFFKVAYVTAIRSGALLNLTWKDITPMDDKMGYIITLRDKGKVNKTPITNKLYEELLQVEVKEDRVFPTTSKSLSKILKDYCLENNIDRVGRNIVLHSIKKASVDKVFNTTGDLLETANHANHSTMDLILQTYAGRNNGLEDRASYNIFNDNIDYQKELERYNQEELISAILDSGNQQKILNLLKGDKRKWINILR